MDEAPNLALRVGSQTVELTSNDVLDISEPEKTPFFYEIVAVKDGITSYGWNGGYDSYDDALTAGQQKVDEIMERFT